MDFNIAHDTIVWSYIIIPFLIFSARIIDVTIGTVKIILISKGMKILPPLLGFFEVLIWLLAIGQIMQNLTNPVNYLAYALGFAIGTYVGIHVEAKLAMGISLVRVITSREGHELVKHLRENGNIITSINAQGNHGDVIVLFTVVKRKNLKDTINTIKKFNPNAFYTVEDVGFVSHGFSLSIRHRKRLWDRIGLKRK
ncbi:DUF2179 domain-containing protein [bacterium]|nr:DUF2179 domain-containing protein [FCB group bacterium]MBL7190533.1 DUF2179 domain-containing protein [bacterium]